MVRFLVLCGLIAGCRSAAPTPAATSAAPVTSPVSTPAAGPSAVASSGPIDPCEAACAHIEACAGHPEQGCRNDCQGPKPSGGSKEGYVQCVTSLSCDVIRKSMMMNLGPLGDCLPAPPRVSGKVVRLDHAGGAGEVPDTQVVVHFDNAGATACAVDAYDLQWGSAMSSLSPLSGRAHCDAAHRTVLPHGGVDATCAIPSRTQLGATPGASAENMSVVALQATCDAR